MRVATEMEGHPDNVAPAVLGGFTIAWTDAGGRTAAIRIPVHPDITAVVFTADSACATEHGEGAASRPVPHADAAANSVAAALLARAMERDPSLLFEGTKDFLHQSYRAAAMPQSAALIGALRDAGVAAVLSGAGPSVLALTTTELGPDVLRPMVSPPRGSTCRPAGRPSNRCEAEPPSGPGRVAGTNTPRSVLPPVVRCG